MTLVLLFSMLIGPASAAEVEMSGTWLRSIMAPDGEPDERGPRPWVSAREVLLTDAGEAVALHAEWTLNAVQPGWVDVAVVDASVRVDRATLGGSRVALKSLQDGRRHLVAWIDGSTPLVIEGEVVAELRRGVQFSLLPAPVGRIGVETADPVVAVDVGGEPAVRLDASFWTGASSFRVSTVAQAPVARSGELALGEVGIGLTIGDGSIDVRARVRWEILRGELGVVRFAAPGAGADLEVTGPVLGKWERSGDTITAELLEPQDARVELEVRWSAAIPDANEVKIPVPVVEPEGVFRTERALQIARDGDREILSSFGSWEPIPAAALPMVASDLILGTPVSAWRVTDSSRPQLGLLRFTPVSGPPTLVDVAAYDGALSQEGRLLMRAHYTVRNDRGAFLRVNAPARSKILGARVSGVPVPVARDGDTWLVPLEKSVETVQGLLNFPVDLLILSDGVGFEKRDEREVMLPTVDAEVAVTRVSLTLPMGWENRLESGEGESVGEFTEGAGITYGFATGDANVAEADALFQQAVSAWMDNDFERAQRGLEDLRSIGADNENMLRLQSNLDLVLGGKSDKAGEVRGGESVALERRVKEQAQARASKDVAKQEKLLEDAEEAYLSGDYGRAEDAFNAALDIGENLERIAQSESVEQSYSNAQVEMKLAKVKGKKKRTRAEPSKSLTPPGFIEIDLDMEADDTGYAMTGQAEELEPSPDTIAIDFADEEIAGERTKPDGNLVLGGLPSAAPAAPAAPPPPPVEAFKTLDVTASTLDVVIPTYGETVRYQHLLLPAGQALAVAVRARKNKKRGTR